MATKVEVNVDELGGLVKDARLTSAELATRLGHYPYTPLRWKNRLPKYAVQYLKARKAFYGVHDHLAYGTIPDDFDFNAALKELKIKKTDLGRMLGISQFTVSKWGNEPPLYAEEIVYMMYLLKGVLDVGK